MTLDYFYGQSGELFAYFRIPKALFQDSRFRQLSTDARTLYGILLDRMSLSAKNSWVDEHGRVYIIYTVREVQESLCCAEHKAVKLFRELEQADLIERKRRGLGRPSLIYVKNFSSGLPKAQIQNCANSNSCAAESAVQVRPKSQSNKTDKNKTERNHPFLPDETDRLTQREQLEDYFYQALEVELLLRLCPDEEDTIHDNANGLDYTLVNDHYLPNLTAAAPAEQHPTGRWGRLHKMYLKEQHPIRYNQLLLSGVLGSYLAKLDKQAEEQLALTIRQMQEAEGVTEALKAADQLEWVRRMNSIRNRAEEIIKTELIFV